MSKTVLVPISDGVEEIEAVVTIDTLRRADLEVVVAAAGNSKQIKASRGVNLVADLMIADCAGMDFDCIVLPGGMPNSECLRDNRELTEMLKKQAASDKYIAAICAAPAVVLAHHNLIGDRKATCYPTLIDQLGENGTITESVVVDGKFVTSQGPGTTLEFALKLVGLLCGESIRLEVAGTMLAAI